MDVTYMENLKNGYDMLYLAVCALQDIAPEDAAVKAMDLEGVYAQAEKQMLLAITCYSVERWLKQAENAAVDPQLLEKWKEAKNKAIRKNMLLDLEREKLTAFMDSRGIWYMPLKGSIIKDWYPLLGMRQMSDNDILFDPDFQKDINQYMTDRGFEREEESGAIHDCYFKKPVYHFEMHLKLFGYSAKPEWRAYYQNVKERLHKDENSPCGYHFTDEDLYVYMTTHACKHFDGDGHGVRNLLDVCVFLQKKPDMDWAYIEGELTKLGLARHEKNVRMLAQKLLQPERLLKMGEASGFTEQEEEFLAVCLEVGVFGSREHRTKQAFERLQTDGKITPWARVKYLFGRLIPDQELLEELYPKASKHKLLRPLCVLHRIILGISKRPKALWREFMAILHTKKK